MMGMAAVSRNKFLESSPGLKMIERFERGGMIQKVTSLDVNAENIANASPIRSAVMGMMGAAVA